MPKEQLAKKLEEISTIAATLRIDPQDQSLPATLKSEMSRLYIETINEITKQRRKLGNASEDEIQQSLAYLEQVKANLAKTTFLVDSTRLTIQPEVAQSDFFDRYYTEVKRFGTNLSDLIHDNQSTTDKLSTCMKSVVDSCVECVTGAWRGMRQGYLENEGFINTALGMATKGTQGAFMGAASGAADAFMSHQSRAEKQINELKKAHGNELVMLYKQIENESSPNFTANKARIEVIKEEQRYLAELEGQLKATSDPKIIGEISNSVRNLALVSSGSALLSTALETIHDFGSKQKFGGKTGQEVLQEIGKNSVSAVQNYNALMDDPSRSMPSKLWSLCSAFANGVCGGIKGMVQGMKEGYAHGNGALDTLKATYKGALISSIAGFNRDYTSAIAKERQGAPVAKPAQENEVELTPLGSAPRSDKPERREENDVDSPSRGFGYTS